MTIAVIAMMIWAIGTSFTFGIGMGVELFEVRPIIPRGPHVKFRGTLKDVLTLCAIDLVVCFVLWPFLLIVAFQSDGE